MLPRVDAQFLHEEFPDPGVLRERLGLAAGTVEREHQLSTQALPQGVFGAEPAQISDQILVAAQRQAEIDELSDGCQPAFLQDGGGGGDDRAAGSGHGGTAPQGEGAAQQVGRLAGPSSVDRLPRLLQAGGEEAQVEPLRVDVGPVARSVRDDHGPAAGDALA